MRQRGAREPTGGLKDSTRRTQMNPATNVIEVNRRMVEGRSGIVKWLALLSVAAVATLGTWIVIGSESERQLGPHDGLELPAIDTGRVAVGDVAPDFSLMTYAGTVTTLSDFRGGKNVVLVFYRGHW